MTIAFHLLPGREGFVRGVRAALLTVTLFVFAAAFVAVCLLRHDDVFVRRHQVDGCFRQRQSARVQKRLDISTGAGGVIRAEICNEFKAQ